MIVTILSSDALDLVVSTTLFVPVPKATFCEANCNDLVTLAGTSGQPLFAAIPAISGHLSISSLMPSPSLSGTGQPSYLAVPAWLGHLSNSSLIPSPSLSGTGQPSYLAKPATLGHLSSSSLIPSPSVSGIGQP